MLKPKYEKFAQAYVRTGSPGEAARDAGYKAAGGLMARPEVLARIDEIRSALALANAITADDIVAELEAARLGALSTDQYSAAISASMGKARLLGLEKPARLAIGGDADGVPMQLDIGAADSLFSYMQQKLAQ